MELTSQISVFIVNLPSAFSRILKLLEENDISLVWFYIEGATDHAALLRMIVDKTYKAIALLEDHGLLVLEEDVISVRMAYTQTALLRLISILDGHGVYIKRSWYTSANEGGHIFLKVENPNAALRILKEGLTPSSDV